MGKSVSTIHFGHSAITRARGLLPMLYRPSELAAVLQTSERTIRDLWIANELPCERDGGGRIFINGADVLPWMKSIKAARAKFGPKMAEGEGYCLRCRRPVVMAGLIQVRSNGKQALFTGECPHCGNKVNRGSRNVNYQSPQS